MSDCSYHVAHRVGPLDASRHAVVARVAVRYPAQFPRAVEQDRRLNPSRARRYFVERPAGDQGTHDVLERRLHEGRQAHQAVPRRSEPERLPPNRLMALCPCSRAEPLDRATRKITSPTGRRSGKSRRPPPIRPTPSRPRRRARRAPTPRRCPGSSRARSRGRAPGHRR